MRSRFGTRLGASVAALALLGGAIAGCGGGDESSDETSASTGGEPVEIEFWHGQTQGPAELLQTMADDFNAPIRTSSSPRTPAGSTPTGCCRR